MRQKFSLFNTIFIDIETASQANSFHDLPERIQKLWKRKCNFLSKKEDLSEEEIAALYFEKAGIYAEFGKIICISIGRFFESRMGYDFKLKSFNHQNESNLLEEFSKLLNSKFKDSQKYALVGHNIKEFDIPYLARRMTVHSVKLPNLIDLQGKKPWEITHIQDTLQLWRFGDYKNYTSLDLLAAIFNIESPKDDIDGSEVNHVYWNEKNLKRITVYCEKDIVTAARVYGKLIKANVPKQFNVYSTKT